MVVPKALERVRSPESVPPPWSGKVVVMFLVAGTAPRVLYEMVCAPEPLKVVPETAPEPLLLKVRAFATEPDWPVMLAFIEVVEIW